MDLYLYLLTWIHRDLASKESLGPDSFTEFYETYQKEIFLTLWKLTEKIEEEAKLILWGQRYWNILQEKETTD